MNPAIRSDRKAKMTLCEKVPDPNRPDYADQRPRQHIGRIMCDHHYSADDYKHCINKKNGPGARP